VAHSLSAALERTVIRVSETFAWLVLAVVVALFGQLPLREIVGKGYIQLNDYGQLSHATVFLIGIAYAVATDRHVRLDAFRMRFPSRARAAIEVAGHVLFVWPWTLLLAYYGADPVLRSISTGETFPETGTVGYPLMRVVFALFLLLLLAASLSRAFVAAQIVVGRRHEP
jgi:TRAP-type mannitol/chloroaromatic compound transport system permease small subunit